MNNLNDLNEDFSDFTRAIVFGEVPSSQINEVYPNYVVSAAIEVYRNNYRGNLHDALANAYPVIKQLVGDDFFRFLARKFIDQYPSRNANLHYYGAELASFLANFAPAQELVYLSDVASLEWACHVAYFVADTAILDLDKLSQIAPRQYENLILHTHPAMQVVRSRYPISAIWWAHQTGAESNFQIDLESGPCIVLVSRVENVVQISELSEAENDWLQRIHAGHSLGSSTAATLTSHPSFALQATLLKLLVQGVWVNFTLGVSI